MIDDLIATGGTVEAAVKLIEELWRRGCQNCISYGTCRLKGREKLAGYDVASVIRYEGK